MIFSSGLMISGVVLREDSGENCRCLLTILFRVLRSSSWEFFSFFVEYTGESIINGTVSTVSWVFECVEKFDWVFFLDNNDEEFELILSVRSFFIIGLSICVVFEESWCDIDSIDDDRESIWLLDI